VSLCNDIGRVPPRRPVILLDVDGVLADFTGACLDVLRGIGLHRTVDQVTSYALVEALGLDAGAKAALSRAWSSPRFCECIEPYPRATEGVGMLMGIGDVYAVTAPMWSSPTWQSERADWLAEHMGVRRNNVISAHAKHLVRGDVLVEDKPETLAAWMDAWPGGAGVLIDRPYNRDVVDGPWQRVTCGDWERVVKIAKRTHPTEETKR
jgi:5'(3')-deoxyribonucleotidase